jgi:hypothetical protein
MEEKNKNGEINKKLSEKENNSQSEKPVEPEILSNIPPEVKKVIEMGFSMQRISGPLQNPLMS